MIEKEKIDKLVAQELEDANRTYPLFHSPHEAWAVLLEEVDELKHEVEHIEKKTGYMWNSVKCDREIESYADRIYARAIFAAQEAIQCAAMCMKIKQSEMYKEK